MVVEQQFQKPADWLVISSGWFVNTKCVNQHEQIFEKGGEYYKIHSINAGRFCQRVGKPRIPETKSVGPLIPEGYLQVNEKFWVDAKIINRDQNLWMKEGRTYHILNLCQGTFLKEFKPENIKKKK